MALWDNEPFVPVTATLVTPSEAKLHDSVEFPEPVTLVGEILHDVLFVDRLTRPVNPLTEVTVIVEFAVWPTLIGLGVVAEIVKFGDGLRNSVIGVAEASLDVRLVRFQFISIVLVREYWL